LAFIVFFYGVLPRIAHPGTFWTTIYNPHMGAGYIIIANIIQNIVQFILLLPQFLSMRFKLDKGLWKGMFIYALPLIIVGFGGMINEVMDRIMLGWWAPAETLAGRKEQVAIYSACYKLSLLVTIFIQAFRMAAEPFFFSRSREKNSRESYARIMRFFVATVCIMFLFVTLFIDQWKYFIGPKYWVGLNVVPVLLLANICLGVYYNLAIWYKLSNKTYAGMVITLVGVVITIVINYTLIPRFGYTASAWATLACYAAMMVLSYWWGQKVYPIPYRRKKLLIMFVTMLFIYASHLALTEILSDIGGSRYFTIPIAIGLFLVYIQVIISIERNELRRIPLLAKWIRKN